MQAPMSKNCTIPIYLSFGETPGLVPRCFPFQPLRMVKHDDMLWHFVSRCDNRCEDMFDMSMYLMWCDGTWRNVMYSDVIQWSHECTLDFGDFWYVLVMLTAPPLDFGDFVTCSCYANGSPSWFWWFLICSCYANGSPSWFWWFCDMFLLC